VSGFGTDPNAANNSVAFTTSVASSADVAIAMAPPAIPVGAGANATFTITATNNGPNPASALTAVDTLPAGLTYLPAPPSKGRCSQASGTLTCTVGSIATGASATFALVATTSAPGNVTNSATLIANQGDPNPANNIAAATALVVAPAAADLAVTNVSSI